MLYGNGLPSFDEIYRVAFRLHASGETLRFREIVLLSEDPVDDLVARAYAQERGVRYGWRISAWRRSWLRLRRKYAADVLSGLRLLKMIVRSVASHMLERHEDQWIRPDFLFTTSPTTLDPSDGTDRILQALLDRAGQRGLRFTGVHIDFRRNLGVDTLTRLPKYVMSWEFALTVSVLWKAFRVRNLLSRKLRQAPGRVFSIPACRILQERLGSLSRTRLLDAALAVEMTDRLLQKVKPRWIVLFDEYDMWGRALVVGARKAGIRTIAVQHGMISENHAGYIHLPEEMAPTRERCPVPDVTAVHGIRSRETLLSHGCYPPPSVYVTGSLILERVRARIRSRNQVRLALGISDSEFLVAFFGVPEEVFPSDRDHVETLCKSAVQPLSLKLILKPHPSDSKGIDRYRSIAKSADCAATVLTSIDSWELIEASDAVAAFNSTVGLDAMVMERPFINLNLSGLPDLYPFVSEGGAIGVYRAEDLPTAFERLQNAEERKRIIEAQRCHIGLIFAQNVVPSEAILALGSHADSRVSIRADRASV